MNTPESQSDTVLANARLRPRRRWSYIWMVPVVAVLIAAWLMLDTWRQTGFDIHIRFLQGHGLKAGDTLRHRGISAGLVTSVVLADNLRYVDVTVRLEPGASALARAGSRFWIVRPQIALDGISGLDTVVGAHYLRVLPGVGQTQREFIGLASPPAAEILEPGGLEISLKTPGKGRLQPGAPISYRQVIIGTLLSVDLAKDASAVETKAYIKPDYVNLIRENIRFWRNSGAQLSAGLKGFSVSVDSFHSLILGGVNLAIPPNPGKRVAAGTSFVLYDKPEDEWLSWIPGLSLYQEQDVLQRQRPYLVSATMHWRYRNWLYLKNSAERHSWALPVADGLIGPADVLLTPAEALPGSAKLTLSEEPYSPAQTARPYTDTLAILPLDHDLPGWPVDRQRRLISAEDSLVITGTDIPARFITAENFQQREDDTWIITPTTPFNERWHGAAVMAAEDSALLGLLLVTEDEYRLAPLSAPAATEDD